MRTAYLVLLSLFLALPAYAARISGLVLDASGAPISGAMSPGTTEPQSGNDGSFLVPDAPTGTELPVPVTRQRQNTDTVRASGMEIEVDVRPHPQWALGARLS